MRDLAPHLLRRLHRLAEKVQVRLFLTGIDEGQRRVSVEPGDTDPGGFRRRLHGVQVLVRPAPKLNKLKAIGLCRLETLQKGKLTVHRLNTGRLLQNHVLRSSFCFVTRLCQLHFRALFHSTTFQMIVNKEQNGHLPRDSRPGPAWPLPMSAGRYGSGSEKSVDFIRETDYNVFVKLSIPK